MIAQLFAYDLTQSPGDRALLNAYRCKSIDPPRPKDLPEGIYSPMGFWLSSEVISNNTDTPFCIQIDEDEPSAFNHHEKMIIRMENDSFTLNLNSREAQVIISKTQWAQCAESILLVITQYWRFLSIENQLNSLSNTANDDLCYVSKPQMSYLWRTKPLVSNDVITRRLAQDMPFFEGPCIAPSRYLDSKDKIRYYKALSKELNMDAWSEQLNTHLEILSELYGEITDKLFFHKGYLVEIILEVMIVVILLVDFMYR